MCDSVTSGVYRYKSCVEQKQQDDVINVVITDVIDDAVSHVTDAHSSLRITNHGGTILCASISERFSIIKLLYAIFDYFGRCTLLTITRPGPWLQVK